MDRLEDVFFSGTHGGETLSLAAAQRRPRPPRRRGVRGPLREGRAPPGGDRAGDRERAASSEWVTIGGAAPRTVVTIREPRRRRPGLPAKTLVQQELVKRGVLFNGSNFICLAHSDEDIDQAVEAYAAAFARLADGLAGDLSRPARGRRRCNPRSGRSRDAP